MPWLYTGKVIREGRAWTDSDGVQHPRNWAIWSDEQKTAKGLVWEEPAASFDWTHCNAMRVGAVAYRRQ